MAAQTSRETERRALTANAFPVLSCNDVFTKPFRIHLGLGDRITIRLVSIDQQNIAVV